MKLAEASLVPIFATPFGTVQLQDAEVHNNELRQLIDERATADYRAPLLAVNPLCFHSRDDFLEWADPPVQTLKRQMLSGVTSIVAAANLYTVEEFDALRLQVRGWFTLVRQYGGISANSYSHTSWCAVYCVAAPERADQRPDSGALRLYESRLATSFVDASTWRMRPPFGHGHYLWQPMPGHMVVFPASIPHEVAPLRAAGSLALVTVQVQFATPQQQSMQPW